MTRSEIDEAVDRCRGQCPVCGCSIRETLGWAEVYELPVLVNVTHTPGRMVTTITCTAATCRATGRLVADINRRVDIAVAEMTRPVPPRRPVASNRDMLRTVSGTSPGRRPSRGNAEATGRS